MKIGIITYHQVINDGAVLQTYAQQTYLQKMYPEHEVEVIDFRYKSIERREQLSILKDFLRLKKSALSKLKKFYKIRAFVSKHLQLSGEQFISDDIEEVSKYINRTYDVVIVGSDEVWKIEYNKYSRPFPNLYWCPKPINAIRIAAAASANSLDLRKIKEGDTEKMKEFLQDFALVGLRDRFTYEMVKNKIGEGSIHLMPDPTFSLAFDDKVFNRARSILEKIGIDFSKPIVCFSMSGKKRGLKELSMALFEKYDALGYTVVSIGQSNPYTHYNLSGKLDPLEWAHIYRFFYFCITDRFHSTIFSIRNRVNFVSVPPSGQSKKNAGKIHDLLERANLLTNFLDLADHTTEEAVAAVMNISERPDDEQSITQLEVADEAFAKSYAEFMGRVGSIINSRLADRAS